MMHRLAGMASSHAFTTLLREAVCASTAAACSAPIAVAWEHYRQAERDR